MKRVTAIVACVLSTIALNSYAADVRIPIDIFGGPAGNIGYIEALDTPYGLLLTPDLRGLTPGTHGIHIHENPACEKEGDAAGGHLDPTKTDKHLGPYDSKGHLGDLPSLVVSHNGTASRPLLAPRLKVKDILNHAIIIHSGGDNYSDIPTKLGGGGKRVACGIIK